MRLGPPCPTAPPAWKGLLNLCVEGVGAPHVWEGLSALPWVLWALWALMALLERRTWACVPAPWELGACGLNKGKGSESLGVCAPAAETGLGGLCRHRTGPGGSQGVSGV